MKQNDSVFAAVCSVLSSDGFDSAVELTKEQRGEVIAMVTNGIVDGSVDFSAEARAKHDTPEKIKGYVVGMVSNHIRKDKRLNGDTKYEIKNPGSRAGAGDDQLKALKALRSTLTEANDILQIDAAIEARKAELTVTKAVTIDVSKLPEEFRHLVK